MKNRLFYFAACVALVLSSVSCSSDDGEEEDADITRSGENCCLPVLIMCIPMEARDGLKRTR